MEKCKAQIGHGPGHQSRSTCEVTGQHRQHATRELYWTKKKAFSGYFDESPEREGEPDPRRAKRIWEQTKAKPGARKKAVRVKLPLWSEALGFMEDNMDSLECEGVQSYIFRTLSGRSYHGTTPEFAIKKAMEGEKVTQEDIDSV